MAELSKEKVDAAIRYNLKRNYSKKQIREIQTLVGSGSDGLWGPKTVRSIGAWQDAKGVHVDGKAGPKTYAAMFPEPSGIEKVPQKDSAHPVLHPLPKVETHWGYDHCPWEYLKPCPTWEFILQDLTFEDGLLKLVSGARKKGDQQVFSRAPDSWISLDELSIGFAHWWADTAPDVLSQIAGELPELAAHAWGEEVAAKMTSEKWLQKQIRAKRGKRPHQKKYDWLLSGWWEIALHPKVIQVCIEAWLESYTPDGLAEMKRRGWKKGTTLAGLIRVTNSRGGSGMRALLKRAIKKADSEDENVVMETLYFDQDLYDHPNRWERLISMVEFRGYAPTSIPVGKIVGEPPIIRVDGSVPSWVSKGL